MNDLSEGLLEFLAYVEDSTDDKVKHVKGNLVKSIHKRVQEIKNDVLMEVHILKKYAPIKMCIAQIRTFKAQSRSYMTLLERDREKIEEGKIEVLKETIMDNLRKLGDVPKNLIYFINEQNDIDILKRWNKISVIAKSFDEFEEKIK